MILMPARWVGHVAGSRGARWGGGIYLALIAAFVGVQGDGGSAYPLKQDAWQASEADPTYSSQGGYLTMAPEFKTTDCCLESLQDTRMIRLFASAGWKLERQMSKCVSCLHFVVNAKLLL